MDDVIRHGSLPEHLACHAQCGGKDFAIIGKADVELFAIAHYRGRGVGFMLVAALHKAALVHRCLPNHTAAFLVEAQHGLHLRFRICGGEKNAVAHDRRRAVAAAGQW